MFGKLLTSKNVITWMPESSCFKTPFPSESVHRSQALLKSARQLFHTNFPLIEDEFSYKMSRLVRTERLGLFGNKLAADHMYSRHNWGTFLRQVKTPLSQKRKTLYQILIQFLESTQNYVHFEEKDQLYSFNIWEVIDSKICGYLNARKLLFWNTLPEWKCSVVPNTVEDCTAALLS